MANNKNPNQEQPGEKEPGKFHYNPGNMSGKTIGTSKDDSEQSNADGTHNTDNPTQAKFDKPLGSSHNDEADLRDVARKAAEKSK
jgi:hypothetical protein